MSEKLSELLSPGELTFAWIAGKSGGIFIGFRKEYVEKLERISGGRT
jgi:hypothetical protein